MKSRTITFEAEDKLLVTADLYMTDKEAAPYIILFHQAGYSRGEYTSIAPRLNKLGFNCLAVDQRSGNEARGVVNNTASRAKTLNMGTDYTDAFPDLEASLKYVKNELKAEKIIIWGSSYSASLTFVLADKYKNDIDGILTFSPGEYFTLEDKMIEDYAQNVVCPVFVTSGRDEVHWKAIYDKIPSANKTYYIPEFEGIHGSSALWDTYSNNSAYWEVTTKFLETLL